MLNDEQLNKIDELITMLFPTLDEENVPQQVYDLFAHLTTVYRMYRK